MAALPSYRPRQKRPSRQAGTERCILQCWLDRTELQTRSVLCRCRHKQRRGHQLRRVEVCLSYTPSFIHCHHYAANTPEETFSSFSPTPITSVPLYRTTPQPAPSIPKETCTLTRLCKDQVVIAPQSPPVFLPSIPPRVQPPSHQSSPRHIPSTFTTTPA